MRTLFDNHGVLMYHGDVQQNKYHGEGKCFDGKGNLRYEGQLENNLFHGHGTLFDANGKVIFSGVFDKHQMKGQGLRHGKLPLPRLVKRGRPRRLDCDDEASSKKRKKS